METNVVAASAFDAGAFRGLYNLGMRYNPILTSFNAYSRASKLSPDLRVSLAYIEAISPYRKWSYRSR
jgi:hypothetical protein